MSFFKKSDIVIIFAIIAVSIATWLFYRYCFSDKPARAEIYYYSTLIETIDLNTGDEKTFSIPQNEHVVFHLYKDGKIRFEQSNCPDQICVRAGKLDTIGQYAACLPNGIILKIVSEKKRGENDLDAIVGN